MCKVRHKTKGFTMLELILALAIGAMFSAIFFQFFFTHQKALNSTVVKSELQWEMQQLTDYFSQSAMEASKIQSLNGITDVVSVIGTKPLSTVTFYVDDGLSYEYRISGSYVYCTKVVTDVTGVINRSEKEISSKINDINITPLNGNNFQECKGVQLEFNLISDDGKITYNRDIVIYYRN